MVLFPEGSKKYFRIRPRGKLFFSFSYTICISVYSFHYLDIVCSKIWKKVQFEAIQLITIHSFMDDTYILCKFFENIFDYFLIIVLYLYLFHNVHGQFWTVFALPEAFSEIILWLVFAVAGSIWWRKTLKNIFFLNPIEK